MPDAVMRRVEEIHRVVVGCPCGAQFSLPIDGYSYRVCQCWRVWEHGWRSDDDHERFLAIHDHLTWLQMQGGD